MVRVLVTVCDRGWHLVIAAWHCDIPTWHLCHDNLWRQSANSHQLPLPRPPPSPGAGSHAVVTYWEQRERYLDHNSSLLLRSAGPGCCETLNIYQVLSSLARTGRHEMRYYSMWDFVNIPPVWCPLIITSIEYIFKKNTEKDHNFLWFGSNFIYISEIIK